MFCPVLLGILLFSLMITEPEQQQNGSHSFKSFIFHIFSWSYTFNIWEEGLSCHRTGMINTAGKFGRSEDSIETIINISLSKPGSHNWFIKICLIGPAVFELAISNHERHIETIHCSKIVTCHLFALWCSRSVLAWDNSRCNDLYPWKTKPKITIRIFLSPSTLMFLSISLTIWSRSPGSMSPDSLDNKMQSSYLIWTWIMSSPVILQILDGCHAAASKEWHSL